MRFTRTTGVMLAMLFCTFAMLMIGIVVARGAQDQKPEPKKQATATFKGDKLRWQGPKDKSLTTIIGHAVIKYEDTTVTADKAVYDEAADTFSVDGSVKIVDAENEITGDKAMTYLRERRNTVEGNVKLTIKPKPDEAPKNPDAMASKVRQPTTVTCDKLEYLNREKIATAEGNLTIVQKERTLTGDKAVYDVKQELVNISGNVRVTDDKGQTFTSPGVVRASLKSGDEWIETENGSATVNVKTDDNKEGVKPSVGAPETTPK